VITASEKEGHLLNDTKVQIDQQVIGTINYNSSSGNKFEFALDEPLPSCRHIRLINNTQLTKLAIQKVEVYGMKCNKPR
jgi:hypothetical protein